MGRPVKELDIDTLFDLLERGTGKKDIAEEMSVSVPTLSKRIAQIQRDQSIILQYRALQNLQLTELQGQILERITPEKIDEAPLRDLVLAYKILKERELVDTGKPSDIKGFMHYLIEMEKEELAKRTAVTTAEVTDLEETESGNWEDLSQTIPDL